MDKKIVGFQLEKVNVKNIYTINLSKDSIILGHHKKETFNKERETFYLRVHNQNINIPNGIKYQIVNKKEVLLFETLLSKIVGLKDSVIYFGTLTDPFLPFEENYDISMKILNILGKYIPLQLIVQTRSPLIVLSLPILKSLKNRLIVTIPVETNLQTVADKFTPNLPKVFDRINTASALKNLDIDVNFQVSPLLPYGDWKKDAQKFADLLCKYSKYISINESFTKYYSSTKLIKNKTTPELYRKLAENRLYYWLRSDSAQPLIDAIKNIDSSKLNGFERFDYGNKQLSIFAA